MYTFSLNFVSNSSHAYRSLLKRWELDDNPTVFLFNTDKKTDVVRKKVK